MKGGGGEGNKGGRGGCWFYFIFDEFNNKNNKLNTLEFMLLRSVKILNPQLKVAAQSLYGVFSYITIQQLLKFNTQVVCVLVEIVLNVYCK